jgi:hypothetical protein
VTNDELSSTFRKKKFYFSQKVQKSAKKSKKYFTYISIKIDSILKTFFTKMISAKISANPESFNGFGGGRRMDLAISHGYTCIYIQFTNNIHVYTNS